VAVIIGVALACVLAACGASSAAVDVARGPVPPHGGFCRGPVLRHGHAKAYVIGSNGLTAVDLATGKTGKPLLSRADPKAIAISPDGRTAYAGTAYSVVPIDVTTNAVGQPIPTPAGAESIAISPDGRMAYASGGSGITPISLRTCTAGRVIATPQLLLYGPIAITPDGRTAYLAGTTEDDNGATGPSGFLRVDLTRGIAGKLLPTPAFDAAAVTPDGRTGYIAGGQSVVPVNLATGKAGKPIKVPGLLGVGSIAISPDGHTAYVGNVKPETPNAGVVVPVDLATGTAERPIHVPSYPVSIIDIAITADGRTAYVPNEASVIPVHLATGRAGKPIKMPDGGAYFIAVTP
jgi:hypothetical protein